MRIIPFIYRSGLMALIAISCQTSMAQEFTDLNNRGDMRLLPIQHASMVLQIQDLIVYVDPWGEGDEYKGVPTPDIILITDIHSDHFSISTIEAMDISRAKFVVPLAVADQMPAEWRKKAIILNNGESQNFGSLAITATPMYNLPESSDSHHVKGRGNGYVLFTDDFRIYISGDTEDIQEMRSMKDVDVAFVCMNQPYTMSVEQAADAVNEFQPSKVYPYHYRNGDKSLSDLEKFKSLVNEEGVEVMILDWYPIKTEEEQFRIGP